MKITALLLSFLGITSCQTEKIPTLEPQKFLETMKADTNAVLLDVRQPSEFLESHLEGATNIDFLVTDSFDNKIKTLDNTRTYYVYCRSGRRSHAAAEKMHNLGLKVIDLQGGILSWKEQHLPLDK